MSPRLPDAEPSAFALFDAAPQAEFTLLLRLPSRAKPGALERLRPLLTCDLMLRQLHERSVALHFVCDQAAAPEARDEHALLGLVHHAERGPSDDPVNRATDPTLELVRKQGAASESQRIAVGHFSPRFTAPEAARTSFGELDLSRLCRDFEPDALRYLHLSVPYRQALTPEFTLEANDRLACAELDEAERRIEYLYRTRERLAAARAGSLREHGEVPEEIDAFASEVRAALAHDLDSPRALQAMMELLKQINELAERAKRKKAAVGRNALERAADAIALCEHLLGLGSADAQSVLSRIRDRRALRIGIDAEEISRQVRARVEARMLRDFARADALREAIEQKGVELIDDAVGTHWRIP